MFVVAGALALAGYTSWASQSGQDALITSVSALVVLWLSGFLLFYGHAAFRAALFPLLFLAFMVPIPSALLAWVTQFLKWGSAEVVAGMFALSGSLLGTHVDTSFITGGLHHEGGIVFYLIALAILAPIVFWLYKSERGLASMPL